MSFLFYSSTPYPVPISENGKRVRLSDMSKFVKIYLTEIVIVYFISDNNSNFLIFYKKKSFMFNLGRWRAVEAVENSKNV